jgi:hypothetical protein
MFIALQPGRHFMFISLLRITANSKANNPVVF